MQFQARKLTRDRRDMDTIRNNPSGWPNDPKCVHTEQQTLKVHEAKEEIEKSTNIVGDLTSCNNW